MLEAPLIDLTALTACVEQAYGLAIQSIRFLPLGADLNTAVYRAETNTGAEYFVKLRRGEWNPASVLVPNHLARMGLKHVIPTVFTLGGEESITLGEYTVLLYPFVEGLNGFQRPLTETQWGEFGAALKSLHTITFPQAAIQTLPREQFSSIWRDCVLRHCNNLNHRKFTDAVALETADFLGEKREETLALVQKAEMLAAGLRVHSDEFVVCHADIHGWNLLVTEDTWFMVDWDTLLLAPRERDLMFIGTWLHGGGLSVEVEEGLFYQGYGQTVINPAALAYYRFERIIEDIAVYCEQIFSSEQGGEDRRQALEYLQSNYLPGSTIDRARRES